MLAAVALRKESVDRNLFYGDDLTFSDGSLSARRAWIEIITQIKTAIGCVVALRKESVDRNIRINLLFPFVRSRSPQGERG